MNDATGRFSNRVEHYIRYRPGYPAGVVELLEQECGLRESSVVADIGSGTGILSEMFLRRGCEVLGVEPNAEMREAGERLLRAYPRFRSIAAAAEATTLPRRSVDFITAGQAFHWFRREEARREFARILKDAGWVVLVWNERRTDSTPFLVAYEHLLQTYGTDYPEVGAQVSRESVSSFFGAHRFHLRSFDNRQVFDFDGLRGRVLSTSYTPAPGHPRHQPMLEQLQAIFDAHQQHGTVAFEYDTRVFYGHLSAAQP
ncbi:MAG TPA: class I SAM-dependent methyltransferase [Pyrinomonadaceae bacterium]